MRYIPVTCEQREAMLRAVGVKSVDDLFEAVPESVRPEQLNLPDGLSEIELSAHLNELAEANFSANELVSFLGAGTYDHYVPSIVDHVVSKPEFFTAYTPYQPEISQGTLQAIYEYQSMACGLTGMDVANASMYDGATALVEAALMSCRLTKRSRVLVSRSVHPEWRRTLATYAEAGVITAEETALEGGVTSKDALAEALSAGDVGAVLVSSPNFYGNLEDLEAIGQLAHDAGALFVVGTNPILLGIMEPPSVYGADIVVAEGQALGNAMSYGGPGLGVFACRQEHVRQMPGRLVGRTTDVDGASAFVLTLSTREQHIRREKATSNICSNHALNALAAGAYLSAVGVEGLAGIARSCVAKAHYLRDALVATGKFTAPWDEPFGYEFTLAYAGDVAAMQETLLEAGYLAGVAVSDAEAEAPGVDAELAAKLVVFAVTEKRTRAQLDAFVKEVASL